MREIILGLLDEATSAAIPDDVRSLGGITLDSLDIDSLDALNLALALAEEYELGDAYTVPWSDAVTVGDMAKLVSDLSSQTASHRRSA